MTFINKLSLITCALGIFVLSSCGDEASTPGSQATAPAPSTAADFAVLKHLSLSEKPANAITISALKAKSPKAGDDVVIQGRIGGTASPFVSARAATLLADDTALVACDASDDDHCPKPWDYCCESKSKRLQNIVTVQALGDDNVVLKTELNGFDDIKAGSYVVVAGKVAEGSNADNLVINLSGLYHDRTRSVVKKGADHKHDEDEHDHDHDHDH